MGHIAHLSTGLNPYYTGIRIELDKYVDFMAERVLILIILEYG